MIFGDFRRRKPAGRSGRAQAAFPSGRHDLGFAYVFTSPTEERPMHRRIPRFTRAHLGLAAALLLAAAVPASATILHYRGLLNGLNEVPVNASPGVGVAEITIDDVANTMRVQASFSGLLGNTTACHIHAPTAVALTGTAGVATMTPAFTGFPLGVTSGSMDHTFDLTLVATYNASYVTANGGTAAGAEAALLAAIAAGKSYFNIHTTVVAGGEIRDFLRPFDPTPTAKSTWSRVKSLFH
jgi:hypothetical protein